MAQPKPVPRVKLIIGVMYKESENCNTAIALLKERFGEIDDEVEYDFNFTEYYTPEMGSQLKKKLLMFKTEIDREWLAQIKLDTNAIEDEGKSEKNNRRINLDPGYLTLHNVVLASAKEMPHKVFIGKGMFGDVVLEYKKDRKSVV